MEPIGKKIEKLRKQAGMTQEELAFELDTTRQTVSKWESGEQMPKTDHIQTMCRLFGVSADFLVLDAPSAASAGGAERIPAFTRELLFARKLTRLRERRGYTHAELGQMAGASEAEAAAWETGAATPTFTQLTRLATVFEVSTDFLLGFHPKRPKQKAADFIKAHKFALSAALLLVLAVGTFLVGLIYGNVVELPPLINPSGPVYSGLMLHLVSKYRLFVKVCFGLATAFLLAAIAMFIVYWKKERPPRRGRKGTPAETAGGTKR